MKQKLTIAELLKKHYPEYHVYGGIAAASKDLDVTPKQFSRWLNDVTQPNCEQTLTLLRKMKLLDG